MFDFPIERYKFFVNENKRQVIAVSKYGGKIVRGVAKCYPGDEFDVEKGKILAAARCNMKVAEKRLKRASKMSEEINDYLHSIEIEAFEINEYLKNSSIAYKEASDNLKSIGELL